MQLKDFIINNIENKKQEMVREYDDKIQQVKSEDESPNICHLLSEIYHNDTKQGEIEIDYLKNILTNDFFKNAKTMNKPNYIVFYNNEFEVMFSKSLSREIKIKFKNVGYKPYYCSNISPTSIKLADLIEVYLNHKTFKNFKILSEYNCRRRKKNFINKILGYIGTYKRCNKDLLDKIREKQNKAKIRKNEYDKELKLFNNKQKHAKNFIKELTNLKVFQDNGWYTTLCGIEDENGYIRDINF